MVWGAVGWDDKSLLVFLEGIEGKRGIWSMAYLEQVLKEVIFPYYNSLKEKKEEEFIFIEDGAKVQYGEGSSTKA